MSGETSPIAATLGDDAPADRPASVANSTAFLVFHGARRWMSSATSDGWAKLLSRWVGVGTTTL